MKILHLQTNGNIRTWKEANAARKAGHEVSLGYVKQSPERNLPGLKDSIFSECLRMDKDHPKKWIAQKSKGYDLIHTHNDDLACYSWWADIPVVHDVHDMASLVHDEKDALCDLEEMAVGGARAVMVPSLGVKERIEKKYDVEATVIHNYPFQEQLDIEKEEKLSKNGKPHVVYAGRMGRPYRIFTLLFKRLAKAGIVVHAYPTNAFTRPGWMPEHENAKMMDRLHPRFMISRLAQYDAGLIPFDYPPYKEHFDASMAHKFWDYLAAGIPVFTTDMEQYRNYFRDNQNTGAVYHTINQLINLIRYGRAAKVLEEWRQRSIDLSEYVPTMEEQMPLMEKVYLEAIKS